MTRTEITEAELVEVGRLSLAVMNRTCNLGERLQNFSDKGRASATQLEYAAASASDTAEIAIELSDKVDALCNFIRRNMEVR